VYDVALVLLTVAVVVVAAVTACPIAVLVPPVDCGVIDTEYGAAAKVNGNVIVPLVEFAVTEPHCNRRPLGNLVYPEVPMLEPVIFRADALIVLILAFTETLIKVELATITFALELAPKVIPSELEPKTILAAAELPVCMVKFVTPSFVFIVVVVKLDIRLSLPFHLYQLLS
jgi:hypothetical protein